MRVHYIEIGLSNIHLSHSRQTVPHSDQRYIIIHQNRIDPPLALSHAEVTLWSGSGPLCGHLLAVKNIHSKLLQFLVYSIDFNLSSPDQTHVVPGAVLIP